MKYIKHTDYRQFCEENGTVFDDDNYFGIPPAGLVYVPLDRITEFFKLCMKTSNKYVVVSADSDFGIEYQEKAPVGGDMRKWINFILDKVGDIKYENLVIPSRCNLEECKLSDTYSVKMYTWTKATFDFIPQNIVHWFCTNCNIEDERITKIPFGLPNWTYNLIDKYKDEDKQYKVYVNFQTNTIDRFALMRGLSGLDWTTVEQNLSHELYIENLSKHLFVLCPEGNGLDSFRIMEALALGSIPIVLRKPWNEVYNIFPILYINNWQELSQNFILNYSLCGNYKGIDKEYWFSKIKEKL